MEQVQPVLEGMPRRLYACTPTRLSTWLDCPRRYRFSYLDRPAPPKGPPWAHNSLGASVHNALAGWWRLRRAERTVSAAGELLDRGWIEEGYAGPAQSEGQRAQAREMVERYAATLDPAAEPLGVERTVGAHTDRIVVSGRIDRLDARRGPGGDTELVVVDYKTGRRPLSTDDARASLPLALYALAAGRIFHRPCRRVELHHLPTGEIHAWEHSQATLDRHVRRAEEIAAECRDADESFRAGAGGPAGPRGTAGDADAAEPGGAEAGRVFPPRPGPGCGWCDFRAVCPEGAAAAPAHRPWDGLADLPGRAGS
jgi:putative RecB family exonuclease